jgi:hypothetical protein
MSLIIHRLTRLTLVFFISLTFLFLGGCQSTNNKELETTGFLDDYSQLQADPDESLALLYVNPSWKRENYDRILLEPLVVEFSESADPEKFDEKDIQQLRTSFQEILLEELDGDFLFVLEPGPKTLRMRVAITDAKPQAGFINFLSTLALKIPLDMGSASMEAELTDSLSGERLLAIIDQRTGARMKILGKEKDMARWGHASEAFKHWAKRFHAYMKGDEIDHPDGDKNENPFSAGQTTGS